MTGKLQSLKGEDRAAAVQNLAEESLLQDWREQARQPTVVAEKLNNNVST